MEDNIIPRKLGRLETSDFVITPNQINYESEIATYVVPAQRVIEIADKFMGLKLMTGDRVTLS